MTMEKVELENAEVKKQEVINEVDLVELQEILLQVSEEVETLSNYIKAVRFQLKMMEITG